MEINFTKGLSTCFVFFLIIFGVNAQINGTEKEGKSDEPVVQTWQRAIGTIRSQRGDFFGFVYNKTEVLIPFEYSELPMNFSNIMVAKKNGQMGVINAKNEVIIPFEYKRINHFENCFSVTKGDLKDSKWGILDLKGNIILPLEYTAAEPYDGKLKFDGEQPTFMAWKENGNVKLFFNEKGILIKEVPYRRYQYLSEKYIWVVNDKIKYGILTHNDEVVLECKYKKVSWAKDSIACVSVEQKMFLINLLDKTVHHDEFDYYRKADLNNNIIFHNNERNGWHYGLMKQNGEIIIAPKHQFIGHVKGTNLYVINQGGKIVDIITEKGASIDGIKEYPTKVIGLRNGFYYARHKSDQYNSTVFKSDRTKLNNDLYRNVSPYNPLRKYPANIDTEKLLGRVNIGRKQYYLYMDGTKVEID